MTFEENASQTDSVSSYQLVTGSQSLTTFASLSPTFSYPNHSFVAWNTLPNGTGLEYGDGASISLTSNLVLYAIWLSNPSLILNLDPNGGTSTVSSESGYSGTSLVLPLANSITRTGYTFLNWNTQADGLGTSYAPGSTFVLTSSISLYAQWLANSFVIQFATQGGSLVANDTYTTGLAPLTLPTSTMNGYQFMGWFTEPSGGVIVGMSGAQLTPTSAETLYAQWAPLLLSVSYDLGGATGALSSVSIQQGQPVTLPGDSTFSRTGYTFDGWSTSVDGSGATYAAGASVVIDAPLTFYAKWVATPATISFKLDGASGSVANETGVVGQSITLPTGSTMIRTGFQFTGWNTTASGSGAAYLPGASLTLKGSLTLFAQWKRVVTALLYGTIGSFAKNSAALTRPMMASVDRLALDVKSHHYSRVVLYGYAVAAEHARATSLSLRRAHAVATVLNSELRRVGDAKVKISFAGEGVAHGSSRFSLAGVEVFMR
ncbi:MAG TPA: InlB B-repeat-containing protein [Acidimicrobiales bacterium]|nr:InlB B-repeat-containing protein [Acidimicrobiales bacterium]